MKILWKQSGAISECLGYIKDDRYGSIYYLIQGPNETSHYSYNSKEDFVKWLTHSDFSVSFDVNKVDLSSRYAWAEKKEIIFLNCSLMETE